MPGTRKSHPPSLKAKVAVEAIKAHKTTAQIAQMFGVHPTQVGGWKKQALAGLPDVFGNGREQIRQQTDAEKDELYKQMRHRDLLQTPPGRFGKRETESQNRTVLFRGRHFEDVIIILCVRWYLRYSLSYRDLEEMMAERSLSVDHASSFMVVEIGK